MKDGVYLKSVFDRVRAIELASLPNLCDDSRRDIPMKEQLVFEKGDKVMLIHHADFEDGEHGSYNWQYQDIDIKKHESDGWREASFIHSPS